MFNLCPQNPAVITHGPNLAGRDFIVGDIHGAYALLDDALAHVEFDGARDRLFSTGDLVDRGPASESALRYLQQPWFHPVLGNHEAMYLDYYRDGPRPEADLAAFCANNARQWWETTSERFRSDFLGQISRLPYIREVHVGTRTIGILHAEPLDCDWTTLKALIRSRRDGDWAREHLLWSRNYFRQNAAISVADIDWIYVGHNSVALPAQIANILYIDTNAARALRRGDPATGRMILIEMSEHGNLAPQSTSNPFVAIMPAAPADLPQFAF